MSILFAASVACVIAASAAPGLLRLFAPALALRS